MPDIRYTKRSLASGNRLRGFQDLVRHRIQDVLLVSSLYDAFTLTADGELDDLTLDEFLKLNLPHAPTLTRVSTGADALELALAEDEYRNHYDLIISSLQLGDMDVLDLVKSLRKADLKTPVVVLSYDNRELDRFLQAHDTTEIDRCFLWQGDVRILLAIVHYVEDRLNVEHDTGKMGVQAIILIEDNINFYSSFLPAIYTELIHHSQRLIPEGVNVSQKLLRTQAKPKILLCSNFEEAWAYFSAYKSNVLGVISDVEFPKDGKLSPGAGMEFARKVREQQPDVPVILQSSNPGNESLARSIGGLFLLKDSPLLLQELRKFMIEHFGFGDFVFRMPDGRSVGSASDLNSLERMLLSVPGESLSYHSDRNHFSKWLKARTEFVLAHRIRPQLASDFATEDDLRWSLVRAIREYRDERNQLVVADFDRKLFDARARFYRIGGGSLGGKARGLVFVNMLLSEHNLGSHFKNVKIEVPPSVVVGTDVFDQFLEINNLRDFAISVTDESLLIERFLVGELPDSIRLDLRAFLRLVTYPLAIRSSSLLEDSQYQPFAGVYETYMVSNSDSDLEVRVNQLEAAIKRVFASTFHPRAKAYLAATPYRLEEEKMAVIIQRLVGTSHEERFYPDFAGVARSHNFYPVPPSETKDGVAAVALGFGASVVGGESCIRFSPKFPRHGTHFGNVKEIVQNSQRTFRALTLDSQDVASDVVLKEWGLETAESDGTLNMVGSTYSHENDVVYDGTGRSSGLRLVTFASILKHEIFPLAKILETILKVGEDGTSSPVELEFAVNLSPSDGTPKEFGFLQLRRLSISKDVRTLDFGQIDLSELICSSESVLGNGVINDVRDIVVIDRDRFDRGKSRDVAAEVSRYNADLVSQGIPYVLIVVGRLGSSDPVLGVPVSWAQIAGARVIVEAGFKDFKVVPSQGSHFFQNITSRQVGYFTVNPDSNEGAVDWGWLASQSVLKESSYVRHLRFKKPVVIKMDGKTSRGIIYKPRM